MTKVKEGLGRKSETETSKYGKKKEVTVKSYQSLPPTVFVHTNILSRRKYCVN